MSTPDSKKCFSEALWHQTGDIPFWWEPCASTALKPILSLLLTRVHMPNIGRGPSGQKAASEHKKPDRANCTTVLDPKHKYLI